MKKYNTLALVPCLLFALSAAAPGLTNEELAARLIAIEQELKETRAEVRRLSAQQSRPAPAPTSSSVAAYPSSKNTTVQPWQEAGALDASFGVGGGGNWSDRTSLGGYGELHLNLGDKEEIDFHRWVLFLSHKFNDKVTLFSELELEHSLAGDGKPGEVELEQAYIDFALGENTNIKAGQILIPVGMLNEVHEPDTFFGVERNNVEKNIIPSTWWEGGVAVQQRFDSGFSFDGMLHSGLNVPTSGSSAFNIRSGRQKVAEADASEWAVTGRARYQGVPGLDLSAFVQYQNDLSPMSAEDNAALLAGGAFAYQRGGFGLKALVASWEIDGASFEAAGADSQWGYYVEPSYIWDLPNTNEARVGVFGRFSHYEYAKGSSKETDEFSAGLNLWPVDNVVLKADFTLVEEEGSEDNETFNFGVGYSF